MVALCLLLLNEVNLILYYDDSIGLSYSCNVYGRQVLFGLALWAGLIGCNEQQSSIHDTGASKHRCHVKVVSWAIYERNVSNKRSDRAAHLALTVVWHARACGEVVVGLRTLRTLEYLGVCVS
eukprot:XP_001707705.1 Hypothetical protein GL50803_37430 [Giardia lamblia ATCC 50803]